MIKFKDKDSKLEFFGAKEVPERDTVVKLATKQEKYVPGLTIEKVKFHGTYKDFLLMCRAVVKYIYDDTLTCEQFMERLLDETL